MPGAQCAGTPSFQTGQCTGISPSPAGIVEGALFPFTAHFRFGLAVWDPQPSCLPKWAPLQLQIAWRSHTSQKLHLDPLQPGLGCGSVPKGTLLKLIWLHKSHILLFGMEGEGLESWEAYPQTLEPTVSPALRVMGTTEDSTPAG